MRINNLRNLLAQRKHVLSRAANPPPRQRETRDEERDGDGVVHVCGCDGDHGGEEEDDADEENPSYGDCVDRARPCSERVRSGNKLDAVSVDSVGDDDGDVTEIERWSCDVEDCGCGLGAAEG